MPGLFVQRVRGEEGLRFGWWVRPWA